MSFEHLKVGDHVMRWLGGYPAGVAMEMVVHSIHEGVITCHRNSNEPLAKLSNAEGGWTFDVATGAEIDEDLHWGPKYGITGSLLREMA